MPGKQDSSFNDFLQSIVEQMLTTRGVDLGIFGDILDALTALVDKLTHIFDMPPSGMSREAAAKEETKNDFMQTILPAMIDAQAKLAQKQNPTPEDKKMNSLVNQAKNAIEKEIKEPEVKLDKQQTKQAKKTPQTNTAEKISDDIVQVETLKPPVTKKNPDAIVITPEEINEAITPPKTEKQKEKMPEATQMPPLKKEEIKNSSDRQVKTDKQIPDIQLDNNGPSEVKEIEIIFDDRKKIRCQPENETLATDFIPKGFKVGGTLSQLEKFYDDNYSNFTGPDRNYMRRRIAAEKLYDNLERNKKKSEPAGPVKDPETGKIKLDHLQLDSYQTTNNGCYSCSMELLLKSRGLHLTQQEIRAFRAKGFENDPKAEARMLSDEVGSIMEIGGIITRVLPNTALVEKKYTRNPSEELDKDAFNAAANDVRNTVIKALTKDKSPVSMNFGNHYMTIVGYDPKKDELIYKDSMKHMNETGDNYNLDRTISVKDLIKKGEFALSHIVDIDPKNPNKAAENVYGLEFVNGKFNMNDGMNFGIHKEGAYEAELETDGDMHTCYSKAGDAFVVNTTMKVPNSISLAKDIEYENNPFVEDRKNDPKKQELLNEINKRQSALPVPEEGKTDITDYAKNAYYNRVKNSLDEMTPWQVKNALKADIVRENISRIMQLNEFKTAFESMDKSKPLGYNDLATKMAELSGNHKNAASKTEEEPEKQLNKDAMPDKNNIKTEKEIKEPVKEELKKEMKTTGTLLI